MAERANIPDPWAAAVVDQNRRWLMAYLVSATGDMSVSEDLAQEVLTIAYEKREGFEPGTNFGGWLREIARNCLRRYFEKSRRRPLLLDEAMDVLEDATASSEEQLINSEWVSHRVTALQDCMRKLAGKARKVLEFRFIRNMTSRVVAEHLNMSVSAVNVSVFRAREAVLACVERRLGT